MGQGDGVPGATDLVQPCAADVVGDVPRAAGEVRLGAKSVQDQHLRRDRAEHGGIVGDGALILNN